MEAHQPTERELFIRTICERPGDDTPRLVFADWLEEHGEPEYGAFVRVQCELARRFGLPPEGVPVVTGDPDADRAEVALLRRERESFDAHKLTWFEPNVGSLAAYLNTAPSGVTGCAVVRRGFVDEVRLPLAAFVGGPCGRCGGAGVTPTGRECAGCGTTGRVGGLARRLFSRHPIARVALTDRRPVRPGWLRGVEAGGPNELPEPVFDALPPAPGAPFADGLYPSEAGALAALSDACVSYGRSLAGLPALPPCAPGGSG